MDRGDKDLMEYNNGHKQNRVKETKTTYKNGSEYLKPYKTKYNC